MGMLLVRNRRLKAQSEVANTQPCEPSKVEVVEETKSKTKEVKQTRRKGK